MPAKPLTTQHRAIQMCVTPTTIVAWNSLALPLVCVPCPIIPICLCTYATKLPLQTETPLSALSLSA